jgi:O-antigen/teichoic acid export membrane protein
MSTFTTSTKVAKETTISFVGLGIGQGLRYVYTGLLARWVGVEYLGIYSLANAVTRFAEVIGKAGLDGGLLRFVSMRSTEEQEQIQHDVSSTLKMGTVFALILMGLQMLLSGWLAITVFQGSPLLQKVIFINAFTLPFTVITLIGAAATQGFKLMKYKIAVTNIGVPILLVVTLITTYWLWSAEMTIILPLLISSVLGCLGMVYFLKKVTKINLRGVWKQKWNRSILSFSYPLMFISIIGTFMHWLDITMLGYYTDTATVGLYHPATRTAGLLRSILVAFLGIFAPLMSELFAQKKLSEMHALYKLTTRWILTLALPFTVIFLVFPTKIMLLFGGQYTAASQVLMLLTCATLIQSFIGAGGPTLTMTGHPKVNLMNSIIVVILNVTLNALWIPKYGIIGAASATLISLTTLGIIRSVEIWGILRLHPLSIKLLKPLIAGAIIMGIMYTIRPLLMTFHTLITLFVATMLTFILYGLFLWLLRFDEDDRQVLAAFRVLWHTSSSWRANTKRKDAK